MKKILLVALFAALTACAQVKDIFTPETAIAGLSIKKQLGDIGEVYKKYMLKHGNETDLKNVMPEIERLEELAKLGESLNIVTVLNTLSNRQDLVNEIEINIMVLHSAIVAVRKEANAAPEPKLVLFFNDLKVLKEAFDKAETAAQSNETMQMILQAVTRIVILAA